MVRTGLRRGDRERGRGGARAFELFYSFVSLFVYMCFHCSLGVRLKKNHLPPAQKIVFLPSIVNQGGVFGWVRCQLCSKKFVHQAFKVTQIKDLLLSFEKRKGKKTPLQHPSYNGLIFMFNTLPFIQLPTLFVLVRNSLFHYYHTVFLAQICVVLFSFDKKGTFLNRF